MKCFINNNTSTIIPLHLENNSKSIYGDECQTTVVCWDLFFMIAETYLNIYIYIYMPLELFSEWSGLFDVLLFTKHFVVNEVVPNFRNSYSPASAVSLQ